MNISKMAHKLEKHFAGHGAAVKLTLHEVIGNGERFIFDVKIKKGTKESLVFDRANDIGTALRLPLFQVFKEGMLIRLAVSDRPMTENSLQKMLVSPIFRRRRMRIPIALGYDMRGAMHFADLADFIHALYGGATNSGKTEGLKCLIMSIAANQPVNRANLILIDTGASGLEIFSTLPHLSHRIVNDQETAVRVMQALYNEMDRRIALNREELCQLPALICVVDEYVNLIKSSTGTEHKILTSVISNILQRGRHAKIHMILSTQAAAKKEMLINHNCLNVRMAFKCADLHNSISLIGVGGAEKLPGKGAMLFKSLEHPEPIPLQGAYMATREIDKLVAYISSKSHDLSNKFLVKEFEVSCQPLVDEVLDQRVSQRRNELAQIIIWALKHDNVSVNKIQKRFNMGNRATDVMNKLFKMNIVADKHANQPRAVLPHSIDDIPEEAIELLTLSGFSVDNIDAAIESRSRE